TVNRHHGWSDTCPSNNGASVDQNHLPGLPTVHPDADTSCGGLTSAHPAPAATLSVSHFRTLGPAVLVKSGESRPAITFAKVIRSGNQAMEDHQPAMKAASTMDQHRGVKVKL